MGAKWNEYGSKFFCPVTKCERSSNVAVNRSVSKCYVIIYRYHVYWILDHSFPVLKYNWTDHHTNPMECMCIAIVAWFRYYCITLGLEKSNQDFNILKGNSLTGICSIGQHDFINNTLNMWKCFSKCWTN